MGTTADYLLQRRASWTGAVVRDETGGPGHGQYFRVTESWRDPRTGNWWIQAPEYLGSHRPAGPVYRFDATTWDLPAIPETVVPRAIVEGACWGLAVGTLFTLAWWLVGCQQMVGIAALDYAAALLVMVPLWTFYRIEPTKTMKVSYAIDGAMVATHLVRRLSRERYQPYDPTLDPAVPQAWQGYDPRGPLQ